MKSFSLILSNQCYITLCSFFTFIVTFFRLEFFKIQLLSALEIFLSMHYINLHFTYLLTFCWLQSKIKTFDLRAFILHTKHTVVMLICFTESVSLTVDEGNAQIQIGRMIPLLQVLWFFLFYYHLLLMWVYMIYWHCSWSVWFWAECKCHSLGCVFCSQIWTVIKKLLCLR